MDEASPTAPVEFRRHSNARGRAPLFDAPFPTVVLRLGGIYGPGRTRMIDSVTRGEARLWPRRARAHRESDSSLRLRRRVAHLSSLERALPLYLGVDAEPASIDAVLRFIARSLELRGAADREAEEAARARVGSHKRCRNTRLLASGYSLLRYPTYREGYRALLRSQ